MKKTVLLCLTLLMVGLVSADIQLDGSLIAGENVSATDWFTTGLYDWLAIGNYVNFDGQNLTFNGSYLNDTIDARSDFDTDTKWIVGPPYLYNTSDTIYFNETLLNDTIDARSDFDTDTHVVGDGVYLYNDSTTMYLNETALNDTILALEVTNPFDQSLNTTDYVIFDNINSTDITLTDMLLGSPTYTSLYNWFSTTQSSGIISGGGFTSNGDGSATVSAGTGIIRASGATDIEPAMFFDWSSDVSVSLTDETTNYIYVDYNGGTPIIGSTTTKGTCSNRNCILLGKIFREGTDLHLIEAGMVITEATKRTLTYVTQMFGEVARAGGYVVAETGERYLTTTNGVLFAGLTRITTTAIDTSGAEIFEYYYQNGTGGWTEGTASQIDNGYWDDGTGVLNTLTANRYAVFWVYGDADGHLMVVYGQGDYTLTLAEASNPPSSLPNHVSEFGFLSAKILVKKSATNLYSIASAYDTTFNPAGATDHGELSGLADDDHTQYLLVDGSRAMTNDLIVNRNITTGNLTASGTVCDSTGCIVVDTTIGNCSVTDSCADIIYETELDSLTELNGQILDAVLTGTDTLTSGKWCVYDGTSIDCNVEPVVDTDTHVVGDGIYLYNDSTTMYLNETALNDTIDARDSDTTYTADESYINLVGTQFVLNDTVLNTTIDDRIPSLLWINASGVAYTNYPVTINNTLNITDDIRIRTDSGSSPYLYFINGGGGYFAMRMGSGGAGTFTSTGDFLFKMSGDTNDYFYFKTVGDNPTLTTSGTGSPNSLHLNSTSGYVVIDKDLNVSNELNVQNLSITQNDTVIKIMGGGKDICIGNC